MKIFMTGASGFLGQVVIRRLIQENHDVIALSRSQNSDDLITRAGATPVRGDLLQIQSIQEHIKDVDVVIHCAAPVEFWGPWEKFENGIVNATKNLAELAAHSGVKRFVHISSESVLQAKAPLMDIDEKQKYPNSPNSYYGKAKKIAEEFLLASQFSMEVLIIRPTFIWGNDSNAFTSIASKVKSSQFVWINEGKANFEAVHVENVAEAILLSLTNGKNREVYFITDDEPTTVREFFSNVFESLKLPIPTKSLPTSIAGPAASITETAWKLAQINTPPPLTRFDLSFVSMPRRYNISKAKSDLGYKPVITRTEGFSTLTAIL